MIFGRKRDQREDYDDEAEYDEERDASSEVARARGGMSQKLATGAMVALPLAALGLGGAMLFGGSEEAQQQGYAASYAQNTRRLDLGSAQAASAAPAAAARDEGSTAAPPPGTSAAAPASTRREPVQLAVRKDGKGADLPWEPPASTQLAAAPAAGAAPGRQGEERPGVHKGRPWINQNRAFTIPRGTAISCLPDQPINSGSRGDVTCAVDEVVWAEDGTTVAMWPGTVIEGTVGQGLQGGERRLFVAWDRVRGINGERIPLAGVGASSLGENGIDGTIDTHLWERMRAGVMLTILQGGVQAGVAAAGASGGGGGNTIVALGNRAGGTTSDLAGRALEHDYNRPNTLRRDHADGISVKLTSDVDLSGIYQHMIVGGHGR